MNKTTPDYIKEIFEKYNLTPSEKKEMEELLTAFINAGMDDKEVEEILKDYDIYL